MFARVAHKSMRSGDVKVYKDAEQAVAQIPGLIGGVVQAAMGLDVG